MQGLRLEQAPPLAVPMSFFLTAPVSVCAAGTLLLCCGARATTSSSSELAVALTHLGTLGVLTTVMWGALYQMIPVLSGHPVPAIRLAHAVHAALAGGIASLAIGLATAQHGLALAAMSLLGLALVLFVPPIAWALWRGAATETRRGMQLALAGLVLLAVLGLWMAHGHSGGRFPGPRPIWIQVHLGVALLGWVGALVTAVSFQVVPMFYFAEAPSSGVRRAMLGAIAVGVVAPIVLLVAQHLELVAPERASDLAIVAAAPAAIAVWAVHPALLLRAIATRRRRRADASLLFWRAGLALGPVAGVAAVAAHVSHEPRVSLLFGWVAIAGWAGLIVHGMLMRIVPFLVWFHRFSARVAEPDVPSVRELLPDASARLGFALHAATVAAGAAAMLSGSDLAARATGGLLVATGLALARSIVHALRWSR